MSSHTPKAGNNSSVRFRLPVELKQRLRRVATSRHKSDLSEMLRDVLWEVVDREDPQGANGEQQLHLLAEGDKS